MESGEALRIVIATAIGLGVSSLFKLPGLLSGWVGERVRKQDAEKQCHQAQARLIQTLRKELFPNGGGSLRDRVDQAAHDTSQSLELAREGIDVAKQVRQEMFNHLEWHAEKPPHAG
jgi:hypothetical protein